MMHELPINQPEPRELGYCEWCGGEIYEGDEVVRVDGDYIFVHYRNTNKCAEEYAMERVYDAAGVIDRNKNIE